MSVVVCALVKQWCQEYMRDAYPRAPPHKRGRVRTYLFNGLEQFQLKRFIYGVHVVLHISVFLFFWAVSDFLYNVYQPVGNVARCCLLTSLAVYVVLSISPLIVINSPYYTALTPPIRGGGLLILIAFRILLGILPCFKERSSTCSWLPHFKGIRFDTTRFLVEHANEQAGKLDKVAMKWLLTEDYLSDTSMDKFLESLPGYIHSHFTNLAEHITPSYIITRVRKHFLTCTTSHVLSEEAFITRVSACVNSMRLISKLAGSRPVDSGTMDNELRREHIQVLVDDLNAGCDGKGSDRAVVLRASCVRGLAFQGFLTHLTPPDVETTPTRLFPDHLLPLYISFCGSPPSTEAPDRNEIMWKAFLNDGPLVNLTLLADAILSHGAFHPQGLPLCWKTLDALLKEFGIARMDVSENALDRFNEVLDKAHKCHQEEHRGYRIMPLLEILDTVARGRHLSMVFLGHPRYYGRADVVFGKEQLQNSDLMEAFAFCLPGYIDKILQDERRNFMEAMVCDDDLWTSLQVNLWKAVHLESSVPDKQRIFEACCTVIDAMFLALEDSDRVNWRAPEFGTLSQHFELFVTTCFKGTFVGRATGFRVGLIKLRFCDALLTKFRKEVGQKRGVSLHSQWDVASLARVFFTLEVGGEEDMAFWKSFASGGDIGTDFIQKAREMLDATIRDGPLLNFCKLGHLAVTAVPSTGTGLERADIEKVMELQKKILADEHSPLNPASDRVWGNLNRLEHEVGVATTKSSIEEREMLDQLLEIIREAKDLCPVSAQQLDLASSQTEIHNRIPSQVVNQIDIIPFTTSLVQPRSVFTWRPLRRGTAPPSLSVRRDGSRLAADAGTRPETLSDASSSSRLTSFNGSDSVLPDILMVPRHEDPEPIGDQ